MGNIKWNGLKAFEIGSERFKIVHALDDHSSPQGSHLIFKPRWMIRRYASLLTQLQPKLMFELGIYQGGSSVFFHSLANPEKLVAVELSTRRISSLDDYIERFAGDSLKPFYGIDQADKSRIQSILQDEFGDSELDLVIDDASHFFEETSRSFNTLFPRLRTGGVYVIEDWPWGHVNLANHPRFAGKVPLTKLILELVMACPSRVGLIDKIEINSNTAFIWRGNAEIEEESFEISKCVGGRAKTLISTRD